MSRTFPMGFGRKKGNDDPVASLAEFPDGWPVHEVRPDALDPPVKPTPGSREDAAQQAAIAAPKPNVRPLLRRGSDHYKTLAPQSIEVIQAWTMPFDLGCVVKYAARVHSGVNGLEKNLDDLDKVIHYAELAQARLRGEFSAPSSESSSG